MASCRSKVRVAVRTLVKTRERTRRRTRRRIDNQGVGPRSLNWKISGSGKARVRSLALLSSFPHSPPMRWQ
jgi:hypothetical protein